MSEHSISTKIDAALADPITKAGMHADTSLAEASGQNPAQSIMRPESPIVIPDDNDADLPADDQAAPGNLDVDAGNDLADADQHTPANSKNAGDSATATEPAQQAAPSQPVVAPTFADLLATLDQCKGNYRKIHTKLFVALYTAWVAYRDAPGADKAANQKTFDDKCKAEGIKAKDDYLKFAKLAFGKSPNRASAKSHVIQVAESHHIAPDACEKWLEENGGFEALRTTYNPDGTKKEKGKSVGKSSGASKIKAGDSQYITKAKAALATSVKATIPAGQLDQIDQDAECMAILRQQADGSFAVVAVLNDTKVVEAAYAAHGRTLP